MTVRQVSGEFACLGELLRAAAQVNGDLEAFVEPPAPGGPGPGAAGAVRERTSITVGRLDEAADGAAALFAQMGVGRGDVVCLMLRSGIDYAVAYFGAARLGAVTSGVNLRLGHPERTSIVTRLRPALTVFDPEAIAYDQLPPYAGRLVPRSELGQAAASGNRPGRSANRDSAAVTLDDPVAVVWTSGSTGVPKGAVFAHRNLASVAGGTDVLGQAGDRKLNSLPFPHVGFMTRPWDDLVKGITQVLTPQPWSAAGAIATMAGEHVTVGGGVPTQWALILDHPALEEADLSSLRIVATGGSRVPPELVRELRERLGVPVVVRYTCTEASLGTGTSPGDPDEVVASTVGRPVPGVELELVDENGSVVAIGEVGRVRLRSPAAMLGYLADRSDSPVSPISIDVRTSASVVDPEGWVTTGDLGWLGNDGNLRLVGRATEMYIRGGYNVYPTEVEAVLGEHPALSQVAVVGAPDRVLGEVGVAFLVIEPGQRAPTLDEVRSFCDGRLTDYKWPDRVVVLDELPLTAMGKVDKKALSGLAAGSEGNAPTLSAEKPLRQPEQDPTHLRPRGSYA